MGTIFAKQKKEKLVLQFKNIIQNKGNRLTFFIGLTLVVVSILSFYFVSTNETYYKKTIAKITSITEKKDTEAQESEGIIEDIYKQQIEAVIMNGVHKGEEIQLENTTSFSQTFDLNYKVKDEVFVSIKEDSNKKVISATIVEPEFKRDKYIAYISILFILLILLIGGYKGLRSLTSVIINSIIFLTVVELYLLGCNLVLISSIASLLFITLSIALVSGLNKKTTAAIIGTLLGTVFSMLIAVVVMYATKGSGIHYEEMEFLTRPPEQIFIIEILIGTLGGIMDIAISISSAIKEIYDETPDIERKVLLNSGMEIGKDIMGTMANTLVFAYISGSIPIILLWLKNGYSPAYIVEFSICLEIIRALTGSIGIVLSIPITLFVSVILLKNKRIGEI